MFKKRRIFVLFIALALFLNCFSFSASAYYYASYPENGCLYYIQHVGSGKVLDITDNSYANGARLQIWDKYYAHQNQVFHFVKTGNYWKIIPWSTHKVIEVRDSSYSDGAQVAQWDDANIACQQWSIRSNSDGSVSFINRNSGKYMDVSGNGTTNGTKLIQYYGNNTTAQKFRLYKLYNNDILNAKWERYFSNNNIAWSYGGILNNIFNHTRFSKGYNTYPTPGYTYLEKVEYLDKDTVFEMIRNKSLNKSTIDEIKSVLSNGAREQAVSSVLNSLGFRNVPYIGVAIGILETLATQEQKADWNRFANTAQNGKGIKKTTYIKIVKTPIWGPLNNGTTAYGWQYHISEVKSYEYSVWDGNGGVGSPSGYSGSWYYNFK